MLSLRRGRYRARFAAGPDDLRAAQALRGLCFRGDAARPDADRFDAACRHVLVEDLPGGALVCCFRLLPLRDGGQIGQSYAAQHYDLAGLGEYAGPMVEIGRFCIDPGRHDPDILRVAWAALARVVDRAGAELLFGCSSFKGTEAGEHADAFALLTARHLAPKRFRPRVKAPQVIRFAQAPGRRPPDPRRAMLAMPPLLRSYLVMGGWVSDHAVVDADLGTLHVFTGLEVAAIPAGRKRLLRAAAREPSGPRSPVDAAAGGD